MTARANTVVDGNINGFYESLPGSYDANPGKKYPLLIFLHGIGELGNGGSALSLVLRNGPPMQIYNQVVKGVNANFPDPVVVNGQSFEFIVISPQMRAWGNQGNINTLIAYCIKNYRVDEQKIYLTGLSMGGGITWEYAGTSVANSEKLAGLVPVAGASYPTAYKVAPMVTAHLPVWATHNHIDPTVTPTYTTTYISLLQQAGADPAPQMTIFPDAGHGGWLKTYGGPNTPGVVQNGMNVYQWMLQYRRVGDHVELEKGSGTTTPSVFTVSAGSDVTITLPTNSVKLTGTATVQNETVSTTAWKQVSGPSTATISNGGTITPTVSGLVAGTYVFEVDLTSASGKTASDQVTIKVNPAPVLTVSAGSAVTITLPTNSVKLTATSTVLNTTLSTTSWKQVSGPSTATIANGSTLTPTMSNLVAGSYVFEIDLTAATGLTASAQVTVKVNAAPTGTLTVNAGSDVSITLPTNSARLTATSAVQNTTVSKTSWKQVSGPSTAAITNGTTLTPTVGSLVAGSYVFEVDLTSASGLTASDQVTVTVNAAPSLSVNAGSDVTLNLPTNSVKLTAVSTVANTTVKTTSWKQVSGPSTATIASGTTLTPTVSGLVAGSYVFEIDLTSASGLTASDQVTVTVNSQQVLKVDAGIDVTITLPTNSVELSANTVGTNTTIKTTSWRQVSGPSTATISSPKSATPTVGNLVAGSYVFEIDITSASGLTAGDQVTVTVNPAPVAAGNLKVSAGSDITITLPTNSAKLVANTVGTTVYVKSTDWKQLSGPSTATISDPKTATPTVSNLVAGVYIFQIDVTSKTGLAASDQVKVTVNPGNTAAVVFNVSAGAEVTITLPTNSVTLAGAATVSNTSVKTTSWRQVSGPSTATISDGGTITPTMSNLIAGTYIFQVDLTSANGKTATDQTTVQVLPKTTIFTVSAGPDVTIKLPLNTYKIAGVCTVQGETPATCKWTQVSGPSTATIASGGSITPTVSNLKQGSYVFKVDVTSTIGSKASDQMTLVVSAASQSFASAATMDAGTDSIFIKPSFKLYPNPSHDVVTLSLSDTTQGKLEISLTSADGRVLRQWQFEKQTVQWTQTIDPGNLTRGVYFLVIRSRSGKLVQTIVRN